MPGYDGAGSLFALGLRLTKLDPSGAPMVGPENSYTTEALVTVGLGNTYSEPDAIELRNGAGVTCVYYAPPPTLLGGTIEDMQVCTPDPYILQFLVGGDLIMNGEDVIGYQAPEVNVDPTPNGVAIEAWSRAVVDNAFAADLPYFHWVMPRAKIRPSESMTMSGEDALTPTFTGTLEQNPMFGDGPTGDIDFPTNRIWQYVRVATMPDLTQGLVPVTADSSS
jgi:hypothetical protein